MYHDLESLGDFGPSSMLDVESKSPDHFLLESLPEKELQMWLVPLASIPDMSGPGESRGRGRRATSDAQVD